MATERQLRKAMTDRQFVRFSRRFEGSPVRGYVLDVGPKFFLLGVVNDRIWCDGFECFRISDAREFRPDPYAAFAEAALRKRGERRPRKPRLALGSIEDLLMSGNAAFPLVTIHREVVDPSVCWIGRVTATRGGKVSMRQIRPDASWEDEVRSYRMSEITRVGFGADYEDALYLVGGHPAAG